MISWIVIMSTVFIERRKWRMQKHCKQTNWSTVLCTLSKK